MEMVGEGDERYVPVRHAKAMMLVLSFATFAGLFSETAMNMALTEIMQAFTVKPSEVQWLTSAYLLTMGVLVPLSALFVKWLTTKQLVSLSILMSMLGLAIAALAPSFSVLLIGRIIQAIGTGIMLPLLMNVLLLIFPVSKRGSIMGLLGIVVTAGPTFGPTISGVILEYLNWHFVFWIPFVFYLLVMALGFRYIDNVMDITKPKIDYLSILLSTIGFGGVIYSLSNLADHSFSHTLVYMPLVVGILGITSFILRQFTGEFPILNLRVFKSTTFSLSSVQVLIATMIGLSSTIIVPMYLKEAIFYSAAIAGLILLPGSLAITILSPFVGKLFDKIGGKIIISSGFIIMIIGTILFIFSLNETGNAYAITGSRFVLLSGIAFVTMPSQTNGLNDIKRKIYADGAATFSTIQQIAGAAGTAIAVTLLVKGQKHYLENNPSANLTSVFAYGMRYAFYFILIIGVIGLISTFFLKGRIAVKTEKATVE